MWAHSGNNESIKPAKFEESGNIVILRKNFKLIPKTKETPEHYEYEEWQMPKEQYEIYKEFETQMSEQSDALVELAELIAEEL